jgi:hypothetical protein
MDPTRADTMLLTKPKNIPGWIFEKKRDPTFKFLPEPHEYYLKNVRLWSPSGVFVEIRYVDPIYYNEESRYRGQYVHHATHLIDDGDKGIWNKIHHDYLGFIEAYCEFKEVWKYRPRMRELPIYHPLFHYGVTPDGEGTILGGDDALVEMKTGSMPWWVKYQLAAQDMAVSAWDSQTLFRRRIGLELKVNGKFKAVEFDDHEDDDCTWQANLRTAQKHYREPPQKHGVALGY